MFYFSCKTRTDQNIAVLPDHFLTVCKDNKDFAAGWLPNDLQNKDWIFIPANHPKHWTLAALDISEQHIYYLDSLANTNFSENKQVHLATIEQLTKNIKINDDMHHQWKVVTASNFREHWGCELPQQHHDGDCGVFIIMYTCYTLQPVQAPFTRQPSVSQLLEVGHLMLDSSSSVEIEVNSETRRLVIGPMNITGAL